MPLALGQGPRILPAQGEAQSVPPWEAALPRECSGHQGQQSVKELGPTNHQQCWEMAAFRRQAPFGNICSRPFVLKDSNPGVVAAQCHLCPHISPVRCRRGLKSRGWALEADLCPAGLPAQQSGAVSVPSCQSLPPPTPPLCDRQSLWASRSSEKTPPRPQLKVPSQGTASFPQRPTAQCRGLGVRVEFSPAAGQPASSHPSPAALAVTSELSECWTTFLTLGFQEDDLYLGTAGASSLIGTHAPAGLSWGRA